MSRPWLFDTGVALDCYFSIEDRQPPQELSTFWGTRLPGGPLPQTVEEAVRLLRKALPQHAVATHPTIPVIIQIRDRRLEREGYVLSKPIRQTFYRGSPSDLVLSLKKQYPSLEAPSWGMIGGALPDWDHATPLLIRNYQGSMRDLLSNYLPLSQYGIILWEAESWQDREGFHTHVRFRGRPGLRDRVEPGPLVSFAEGRSAFVLNHRKDGAVAAACRFIETRLAANQPHQVRWAMYFLGWQKAEVGVPVLLKHLHHRYTPHPILREAYPAVYALGQIGPAASRACLRQLQDEDDALRRRLLCQVLLDQMAGEKAARALRDAGREADAASRRRLTAAAAVLAGLIAEQKPPEAAP